MESDPPSTQASNPPASTQGTHVTGNVNISGGDFVGRDQTIHGDEVHGDKVMGDKTTVGDIRQSTGVAIGPGATAHVTIQQTLSEADLQDQNNRRVLRQMVTKFWIEGVLAHSLNHEAAIRLNLADRSHLVENRLWKLIPQQSAESVQLLPPGTPILDIFDQMNQHLLILGEPGAGKTILLLELAHALLKRADETLAYPSPVVFNLSSWVQRKLPLTDWMVDELSIRYNIPKRVAQAWVAQDKLLPLLDGLDEVRLEHRTACAQAINHFHQEHLVPLVVCSRTVEYEQLTVRLKLHGAVLLQPLTTEQIDAYLNRAGPTLATVRTTLHHDTALQELAHSPLMLNIMALAYQDGTPAELSVIDATQTRRQHLLDAYIRRMLFAHREVQHIYSSAQTLRWLKWLAIRILQSEQTIFLIERMQPDWLQTGEQKPSRVLLIMLLAGPLYGLIIGLIFGLFAGLASWQYGLLGGVLNSVLKGDLNVGLTSGLFIGFLFGLFDGFSGRFKKINPIEQSSLLRRKIKSSLYATLFWGLFVGLVIGLIGSVPGGLLFGLIGGLLGGLIGIFREIEPVKRLSWSWQRIKGNLYFGMNVGLVLGLILGLSGLAVNPLLGLILGLSGLLLALIGGLLFALIFQPNTRIDIVVETQLPNQGIKLSARYSSVTSLIFWLLFGLLGGLVFGLLGTVSGGLSSGLSIGLLAGSEFGVLGALIGGLLGGGDVVMKHCILRLVLWWKRYIPWNYARFLDYATALIFLRKVGGGYIFVHRLVMEHFASLDEQEIERITASSNFR